MCEFRYGEAQPWEISLWEKDRSPFISTTLVTKGWSRKRCKYETWKLAFEHNAFYVLHDILESLSFVCFFKLHFGHISCRDVKNKFYVLPWKKQNMADSRIPQYITSKGNIIWSPRTSEKSFECCFRKLKVICFCSVPSRWGEVSAICKTLQNKIQPSKQCSRPDSLLAFDKLREMRLQNSTGHFLPFMLMNTVNLFLGR